MFHYSFSPDEQRFRSEIREFCRTAITGEMLRRLEETDEEHDDEFYQQMVKHGYIGIQWPKEYGGQDKNHVDMAIFNEEMVYARAPYGRFIGSVVFVGQSIIAYGSEEQKQYFLPRIAQGEITCSWCLTEPDAGSDAASLRTKAVKVSGGYRVNGQKVFISGAHISSHAMVAVRTNPDLPKHKGISLLLIPLRQPGVEVRPLWTMRGWRVNEVFFDDVFVPDERLLGGLDQGWKNIRLTLSFERSAIAQVGYLARRYDDVMLYLREHGGKVDQTLLARLAIIRARITAARWMGYRVAWMQDEAMPIEAEASMVKLLGGQLDLEMNDLAMDILGRDGLIKGGDGPLGGIFEKEYRRGVYQLVAGGTADILKNVIAIHGLKLPRK